MTSRLASSLPRGSTPIVPYGSCGPRVTNDHDYVLVDGAEIPVVEDEPLNAQLKSSLVTVFKNGRFFVYRQLVVDASNENATYLLNRVPQAAFGTIFFDSHSGDESNCGSTTNPKEVYNPILQVSSQLSDVPYTRSGHDISTLLEANIGASAKIGFKTDKDEKEISCQIDSVDGAYVVLELSEAHGGDWLTIEMNKITYLRLQKKPKHEIIQMKKQRAIRIQFASPRKEQYLSMGYLTQGLSFMATYSLDLFDDTHGILTLKANVLNDAESLDNVDMNLVVGIPNFLFQDVDSPLSSTQSLRSFLNSVETLGRNNNVPSIPSRSTMMSQQMPASYSMMSNTGMMSQAMPSTITHQMPPSTYPDIDAMGEEKNQEQIGAQSQDLYMYRVKNVSLAKHGRGLFNILETRVDINHIYTVELSQHDDNLEVSLPTEHSISFKNPTSSPFTTGSILLTTDNYTTPIAQSKLSFVPINGYGLVKLTTTPTILVKHSIVTHKQELITFVDPRSPDEKLRDIQRKKDDKNYRPTVPKYFNKYLEGKITIQSHAGKQLVLTCKRTLTGHTVKDSRRSNIESLNFSSSVGNSSDGISVGGTSYQFSQKKKSDGGDGYNSVVDLVWNVNVPSECKSIEIKYEYISTFQSGYFELPVV